MLRGGLMSSNILQAMKEYLKSGGRKTYQIVKESGGKRSDAKKDVKAGLSSRLKSKRNFTSIKIDQNKNPKSISQIDRLNKFRKDKKILTKDINKLK